jgi:peptide/nickel transport system ATP-binding protein
VISIHTTAARAADRVEAPILSVRNLNVSFRTRDGAVRAVKDVSFDLRPRETICLVGESGSGKSTASLALIRLVPAYAEVSGQVFLQGKNLLEAAETELRGIRGHRVGFIFQDPSRALNPLLSVGQQIMEPLRLHLNMSRSSARKRALELLESVGVNEPQLRIKQYPHELSGGLKQRVMIAMAIACEPQLLIADEPTTALDVTIQGQVLALLRRLCAERELALILVTHDFGVVSAIADRVAVMYGGRIVEQAPVVDLFRAPIHPYTRGLLAANPRIVVESDDPEARLAQIPGSPPDPLDSFTGCMFAPRCYRRAEACAVAPPIELLPDGREAACWFAPEARGVS